jgi:hypothetical protein
MAEQPIQGKTIVFVTVVLAAVVGVHMMLQVDDEHATVGNSGESTLATGDPAEQLDPNSLEKRVKDNTRMLLSDDPADRLQAARTFNKLLQDPQSRKNVVELDAELVAGMESALSRGQGDPVPRVRALCQNAWGNLHTTVETTPELP